MTEDDQSAARMWGPYWCILEVIGRRWVAGLVTDVELAGARFLRVDIPGQATQFYAAAAVYVITLTTEQAVLEALKTRTMPTSAPALPSERTEKRTEKRPRQAPPEELAPGPGPLPDDFLLAGMTRRAALVRYAGDPRGIPKGENPVRFWLEELYNKQRIEELTTQEKWSLLGEIRRHGIK